MPETGETHVFIFAEVGFDFLTLGGGFDDEERTTFVVSRGGGGSGTRSGRIRRGSHTMSRLLDFELGGHVYVV